MFTLEIDASDFIKLSDRIGAARDQLPFAFASVMNSSAFMARQAMLDDWPTHVKQRNTAWPSAALRIEKATKQNLTVTLSDVLGRGGLSALTRGGLEQPWRGNVKVIPSRELQTHLGAHGMPKRYTARELINKTPKRALRLTRKGLWIGERGKLKLMYTFKQTVNIGKRWSPEVDWTYVITENMRTGFVDAMKHAMLTRR